MISIHLCVKMDLKIKKEYCVPPLGAGHSKGQGMIVVVYHTVRTYSATQV